MKKIGVLFAMFIASIPLMSYTPPTDSYQLHAVSQTTIYFKVVNNTPQLFSYYVNEQREDIAVNERKGFAYLEGQEVFYWNNGKGLLWFNVTPEMNGKTFMLSQFLNIE